MNLIPTTDAAINAANFHTPAAHERQTDCTAPHGVHPGMKAVAFCRLEEGGAPIRLNLSVESVAGDAVQATDHVAEPVHVPAWYTPAGCIATARFEGVVTVPRAAIYNAIEPRDAAGCRRFLQSCLPELADEQRDLIAVGLQHISADDDLEQVEPSEPLEGGLVLLARHLEAAAAPGAWVFSMEDVPRELLDSDTLAEEFLDAEVGQDVHVRLQYTYEREGRSYRTVVAHNEHVGLSLTCYAGEDSDEGCDSGLSIQIQFGTPAEIEAAVGHWLEAEAQEVAGWFGDVLRQMDAEVHAMIARRLREQLEAEPA